MECLKCGRETSGENVFCAECLKEMEKSPSLNNASVVIHHREDAHRKTPVKKTVKPEDVIARLNKKIKWLKIALAIMTVLFAITAAALGYVVWNSMDNSDLGSNYSTVIFPNNWDAH